MNADDQDLQDTIKELMEINKIKKIPLKNISLKKKIGEGGQAKVYRGTLDNEEVAVKVITEVDWKCLAHEIVILSNLNHQTVPKFYGIILDNKIIGLVFKYISGKTLDEYDKNYFSIEQKLKITKDIAEGLNYIHKNKFIHRDLKLENIMVDNDCKTFLIDYGIAKVCSNGISNMTRAKGTLHYLAPETLEAADLTETEDIISIVTNKVDVWSYGCIVSYLFSGFLPWCNEYKDNEVVIQKLLLTKTKFPIPVNIKDENIKKVIAMATEVDFKKRASMEDIIKILDGVTEVAS
jgi:serine/threonine protein kinase